jgi:hypothetical protein
MGEDKSLPVNIKCSIVTIHNVVFDCLNVQRYGNEIIVIRVDSTELG